ncbi:MAG: glucose-1-phosphate adenylyltransferase [Myxococcota bacterium]
MKRRVLSVIMGGGRGSRLWPLTRLRCKPAVPLGAMYRLVDIPISNCLNSGFNQIYLLTQFNTASLHRHIRESYRFDGFSGGFVELLAAEQTEAGDNWYQGTADAVRQNLVHINPTDDDLVLILSGDQLYRMDYREIVRQHEETGAEVTVAATPVDRSEASAFGLMKVNDDLLITEFVEKPTDPKVIDDLLLPEQVKTRLDDPSGEYVLVSMGIYVFSGHILRQALKTSATDFGKEVIPNYLPNKKLYCHLFEGYWEDIGTVKAFFEANLRLADTVPPFNFFDPDRPIYTRARYLPAAKVNRCTINHAIVANGCILSDAELHRCVIGVRANIREGSKLVNTIMMGAERMESDEDRQWASDNGVPEMGVGRNCYIENTILDTNVRIGDGVHLSPEGKENGWSHGDVFVRDGVMVVTKNAIIPSGTQL